MFKCHIATAQSVRFSGEINTSGFDWSPCTSNRKFCYKRDKAIHAFTWRHIAFCAKFRLKYLAATHHTKTCQVTKHCWSLHVIFNPNLKDNFLEGKSFVHAPFVIMIPKDWEEQGLCF